MSSPEPLNSICVTHLRCEYLVNPLGINETKPRLSWVMEWAREPQSSAGVPPAPIGEPDEHNSSAETPSLSPGRRDACATLRGARQTAWQVSVASSVEKLTRGHADLWDSGRVESDQSAHIVYDGVPLKSRMTCHWQVTVWDELGNAITSQPALWTMGLLKPEDWKAKWISHDPEIIRRDPEAIEGTKTVPGTVPLFRKTFRVQTKARRATLYVSARGLVELQLNGQRVSEDRFIPEWTDYNKRLHYRTFDVTGLVVPGENALGAMLGDGWWSGFIGWQETRGQYGTLQNSLLVQLEVEVEGGEATSQSVGDAQGEQHSFPLTLGEGEKPTAATVASAREWQTKDSAAVPSPRGFALPTSASDESFEFQRNSGLLPRVGAVRLPWEQVRHRTQPQRGCGHTNAAGRNPVGVELHSGLDSQGSSCLATLGFAPKSLWDFAENPIQLVGNAKPRGEGQGEGKRGVRLSEEVQGLASQPDRPEEHAAASREIEDRQDTCPTSSTILVTSDTSWLCQTGPILSADFMMGETYDARRERTGWDRPGFDDSAWLPAIEVAPSKVHIPKFGFSNNEAGDTNRDLPLVAQRSEPVSVVETIHPVSVNEIKPGVFIYDLGQNIAGWVRLAVSGPAGTRIQLRHAERLNPDGTLYTENLRRAKATDVFVLKGDGEEVYEPRFTFHGFQYIELTGLKTALPLHKISGRVVMSSTQPVGEFECSHPLVNRLWKNALWGQKGNFLSVPTDCPQRDERLGWMGDAQVFLRTATYNMDVAAFFTKWMTDVTDSQDVDGIFPDIAPRLREGKDFVGLDGLGGGAGWADAGIIVPWTIWRVYGDTRIIEEHWDAMVRWLDWLEKTNPESIRCNALNNNYGDWLCIPSDREFRTQSPMKTLLATAYWADDAAKMARMARALGKVGDAERFDAMHARVRGAFQNEWLREDGRLTVDTQTAYLLALAFSLLPEEVRDRAAEHLVENIQKLDWHLSTGFIGISHLNPTLTLTGHADVAYRLLLNEDYPSWLYPVIHGATTIWERWNGWTQEDGFFNPSMNSFNHYSLGSVSEWLYRHVAGIELDPDVPGFKRFIIRPFIGSGFTHAGAKYRSIHGTLVSRWRREGERLKLTVQVPPNTTACVYVPVGADAEVLENCAPAHNSQGIQETLRENGYAVFLVQSGSYEFDASIGGSRAMADSCA